MEKNLFNSAVRQYQDMVYRVALHIFGSPQDAEDAVQEVFLRLYTRQEPFETPDHLRRWLIRVTVNECKRISCHPWRSRTVSLECCGEPVFDGQEQRELYQAVMDLPGKYRVPLYLYYYEGYAVDEVGEIMGLNPSTVQTRLARGRAKLKTMLTEE